MSAAEYFLRRLSKDRNIIYGDKKYNSVLECLKLKSTLDFVLKFYKLQDNRPDICCDENGYHISFLKPRSIKDLKRKRLAYKRVADESFGFLSRTPDFINAALTACAINKDVLGKDQYANYSNNIERYYNFCKENHIFVTHASINPQIDRSLPLHKVMHRDAAVKVKSIEKAGITVCGRKMIGTLAGVADEILIFNMPGLVKEDKDFALSFAVEATNPNIDIVLRKSMLKMDASWADYPISSMLDTMDSMIVFNDAFIPWNRIFIFRNVQKSNLFYDITRARNHTGHQGIIRMLSTFELLCGVASETAEIVRLNKYLNVRDELGEITTTIELIKGAICLSEQNSTVENEFICPNIHAIQAIRCHVAKVYARIIGIIQSLVPGSMNSIPPISYFDKLMLSENKEEVLKDKLRAIIINLAWDLTGTEIGQRQKLFEIYNSGDPKLISRNYYSNYNMEHSKSAVSKILSKSIINCSSFVLTQDNKILLIKRFGTSIWYFPGGKVDVLESSREALVSELKKELSLIIKVNNLKYINTLFGLSHNKESIVSLTLYAPINLKISQNQIRKNNEIEDVGFFDITSSSKFAPIVNEFIERYLKQYEKL
ncbi:MAG: NUDIX domain-containing protein [Rickettsiales bacterium]|nr:NUDIX domain-containing protein [Rickettsiales bacterium]